MCRFVSESGRAWSPPRPKPPSSRRWTLVITDTLESGDERVPVPLLMALQEHDRVQHVIPGPRSGTRNPVTRVEYPLDSSVCRGGQRLSTSRKSGVLACSSHSKTTISRLTISAPFRCMRCKASSLSRECLEPTASSITKTWRPIASRSSTVCCTLTWASVPTTTHCFRPASRA